MKVKELIEKLMAMPQDTEIAIHCKEATTEVHDVMVIRRPPLMRSKYEILYSLGVEKPLECKDKKLIEKAGKIEKEEEKACAEWASKNKDFIEPYCGGDGFFRLYDHYDNDEVTEAVCIVGDDF